MSENPEKAADAVWFAAVNDERVGPMTLDQIMLLNRNAKVTSQTNFWKKGMVHWMPAAEIPELAMLFELQSGTGAGTTPPYPEMPAYNGGKRIGNKFGLGDTKGLLGSLFDLSFSSFITTRIIRVIYVLDIILLSIETVFIFFGGLAMVIHGFDQSSQNSNSLFGANSQSPITTVFGGLLIMALSPLFFLFFLALCRILLESIIVFFRIAENTHATAKQVEIIARQTAGGSSSVLAGRN